MSRVQDSITGNTATRNKVVKPNPHSYQMQPLQETTEDPKIRITESTAFYYGSLDTPSGKRTRC